MKNLVLIALSVVAISCNGIIGNGYTVSGEIKGLPDGTMAILEKQGESAAAGIIAVDTVVVKDGKFKFEGKAEEPVMHRVRFDQLGGFMLILEKGDIAVTAKKDSLALGVAHVTGTPSNDALVVYRKSLLPIQKKIAAFETKNAKVYDEANAKKDTATMAKITAEYMKIKGEIDQMSSTYAEKNPDSFISLLIIQDMFATQMPDIVKIKKYFDNVSTDLKQTSTGKRLKTQIDELEKASQANQMGPKKKVN